MARSHWRKPDYWRWFWRKRVALELKAVVGAVLVALTLAGGWLAADRLARAGAGVNQGGVLTVETTVQKLVTVREKGPIVRKLVPVPRNVFVKRRTAFRTTTDVRTVTVDSGARTVQVPVVSRKTITVNAKTKTVITTRLVPVTKTETQEETLTQSRTQTLTQTSTLTETQTITEPVTTTQTVTVNQKKPVTTVTVTVTT